MIQIICRSEAYIYNVYHMIKAFYPSEDVVSQVEEKASNYVTVLLQDGSMIVVDADYISEELSEKEVKYRIDTFIYQKLADVTGHTLAWGILTGVRPTKIAMNKLEEGWNQKTFVPWFMDDCKVSRQKAELSWKIAERERELLQRLDYQDGYSLYVGIPFCPSVCTYCSFSSGALAEWEHRVEDYLQALCKELRFIGKRSAGKKLNSIYIGGGTPTTLSASQMDRLLDCIEEYFPREYLLEYTVEAGRPDSITREKLEVIKKHGITRISINPQSM